MDKDAAAFKMWEFLPDNIQDSLKIAFVIYQQRERQERQAIIRRCPRCSSKNTIDCGQVKDLNDTTIGLCLTCGYLWCLECDTVLLTTVNCGHWQVCSACVEEKDLSGYCGIFPWECIHIINWLKKNHPTV
ncbi:MAG: hypothetical protein C0399_05565 [Syntrophus sp. (in: bacteria)]|nr:hypothetical protein [Syntrophus sp. (in: bacteria)]